LGACYNCSLERIMFTSDTKKTPFTNQDIANIEIFDKVQIESGMGGVFNAYVAEIDDEFFHIKITNKDHEHTRTVPKEEAHNIFITLEAA